MTLDELALIVVLFSGCDHHDDRVTPQPPGGTGEDPAAAATDATRLAGACAEFQTTGRGETMTTTTKTTGGRYTVQITVQLYANSPREAYRIAERALREREVEYVDAEDIRLEPYCVHVDAGHQYEDERDLAEPGSPLCATCQKANRLTMGQIYDVSVIEDSLIGWSGSADGYHLDYYFDADGRYKGADADGIEPLFHDGAQS